MTSRPRIRTIKPELWADERVGNLSRDARLLLVGLITMADDEGRLRAMPATILGHAFPYDHDAMRKLVRWLDEIVATGMVLRYEHEGRPYLAFRHWARHQRPNRPSASVLPQPPDSEVVMANAVRGNGARTDDSVNAHGTDTDSAVPRVRARPGRSGRERNGTEDPPDPPMGGRPAPPEGNRGRDLERYRQELEAWAPHPNGSLDGELAGLWSTARAQLQEAVSESAFNLQLAQLHPHRLAGDTVVLAGPDGQLPWLGERYQRLLSSLLGDRPVDFVPCSLGGEQ